MESAVGSAPVKYGYGIINLYNLLDELTTDDTYKHINEEDSIDNYLDSPLTVKDLPLLRPQFKVSNPVLSIDIYCAIDNDGARWTADLTNGLYIVFYKLEQNGTLSSGVTMSRSDFLERFK